MYSRGLQIAPRETETIISELRQVFVTMVWQRRLETPSLGVRTIKVIRPHLTEWLGVGLGTLTFRFIQIQLPVSHRPGICTEVPSLDPEFHYHFGLQVSIKDYYTLADPTTL